MRRRLDLALGLVTRPAVIFLDEPTTGLDTRSRQALWQIIAELAGDGVTVLLTTQYLEEADQLADRVAVIDRAGSSPRAPRHELKARVGEEVVEIRRRADEALLAERAVDGSPASVRHALAELGPTVDRDTTWCCGGRPWTTCSSPSPGGRGMITVAGPRRRPSTSTVRDVTNSSSSAAACCTASARSTR